VLPLQKSQLTMTYQSFNLFNGKLVGSVDPSGDAPLDAKPQMAQNCFGTWRLKSYAVCAKLIAASRAERSSKGSARTIRNDTFHRQTQLLATIDSDDIKAQFKEGALTVHLAEYEKAPARTRKIAIEKS
jgi:hypothetical protein